MSEFRARMAVNGRIIIPVAVRRELRIFPGEELILRIDNDELRIFSLKHSLKKARETVRRYAKNKSLVKKLKTLRHEDLENE